MSTTESPTGPNTPSAPRTETPDEERVRLRRVAVATVVGTTVEWYDFYLYATMAAIVFGTVFFPAGDSQAATLKAFATFAIGFIARPVGGIVFGHLGDRIGRKHTMVITFLLMGLATAAIGLLPTYAQAGFWAPLLLVVIRILQGMGAGAEYAGAAVNAYEHARPEHRGRQGAWPALGLNLGLVLSSGTVALLTVGGDDFLMGGGWRIPFIASIVLVGIGLWVRERMPESPEFTEVKREQRTVSFWSVVRTQWRGLLVVLVVAIGYNALSYIFKTFSIAYLAEFQDVSANLNSTAITVAGVVALFTVPLFGRLCDAIGSRRVIMLGGLIAAAFAFVFLWLLRVAEPWSVFLAIGFGTGVLAPMMFSSQGSFLSRQFPAESRSTGVGTAREIGTAIAGALAPLGALSLVTTSPTNSTTGVGIVLVIAGIVVVVGALFDQGRRFSDARN